MYYSPLLCPTAISVKKNGFKMSHRLTYVLYRLVSFIVVRGVIYFKITWKPVRLSLLFHRAFFMYLLICTNECTILWLKYYTNISLLYNYTCSYMFRPLEGHLQGAKKFLIKLLSKFFKIIIKLYYYKINKIAYLYGRYCCSIFGQFPFSSQQ